MTLVVLVGRAGKRTLGFAVLGGSLMSVVFLWSPSLEDESAGASRILDTPREGAVEQPMNGEGNPAPGEIDGAGSESTAETPLGIAPPTPESALAETREPLPLILDQMNLTQLQEALDERVFPLYEARFAAGLYEVLSEPMKEEEIPKEKLLAMRLAPDGVTVQRTILPEQDHPHEYAILREILRRREQQRNEVRQRAAKEDH